MSETKKYDDKGNLIYFEMVRGFWYKWEYDDRGNKIRQEDKNGFWWVAEYDEDNHQTYYEDMHGCVIGFRKGQERIKIVNKNQNNAQGWSPFAK
jgi:YD repeat-containing protein